MATASVGLLLRRQIFGKQFLGRKLYKPFDQLETTVVPLNKFPSNYSYSTQVTQSNDLSVKLRNGLPVVSVPLPSRGEDCEFTLKPITHTVGDFLKFIHQEDGGIDRSAIYTPDGNRISKSTTVDILMKNDFTLSINDKNYQVKPPPPITTTHESAETMDDVKALIVRLYSALNIEQHQLQSEKELLAKLEDVKVEIEPLEKKKDELIEKSSKHIRWLSWAGCGFMSVQFGLLARLTWWEYSWDIMEPVTYFITYGSSMAMFAYFVLCKHDYEYKAARDRKFLLKLHKEAEKNNFDLNKYNELKNKKEVLELDIQRLRDPLQLHLPIEALKKDKV